MSTSTTKKIWVEPGEYAIVDDAMFNDQIFFVVGVSRRSDRNDVFDVFLLERDGSVWKRPTGYDRENSTLLVLFSIEGTDR